MNSNPEFCDQEPVPNDPKTVHVHVRACAYILYIYERNEGYARMMFSLYPVLAKT